MTSFLLLKQEFGNCSKSFFKHRSIQLILLFYVTLFVSIMDIGKTLYVKDRKEWREWLESNFTREKEIWLVYPAVNSGKSRISYNDAVEEALDFGWIDSTVKRLDEKSTAQRFSPRNPASEYSQANCATSGKMRQIWDFRYPTLRGLAP